MAGVTGRCPDRTPRLAGTSTTHPPPGGQEPAMRATDPFAFRPSLDTLTDRVVPSVSLVNGDLHVSSTHGADVVRIRQLGANYEVSEGNVVTFIPVSRVTGGDIVFNGLGGNDSFTNATYLRSQVNGGAGNDTLSGGYGTDRLEGGGGSD